MQNLYLLLTIANQQDDREFLRFFEDHAVKNVYCTLANGTALAGTLDMLGIAQTAKIILHSILPHNSMRTILRGLTDEMHIDLPNRGISLAVPLSGIGGREALAYFAENTENETMEPRTEKNGGEDAMLQTELIVVICEKGYTDLVMDAARDAGAGGGTVTRAKGTGAKYTEKFFGLSIADEKELIYIVSTSEKKNAIMTAIMQKAGAGTDAHAVVFSLPVTDTAGLRFYSDEKI